MNSTENAQAIYVQLGTLLASPPDLRALNERSEIPDATLLWLAELEALVAQLGTAAGISEMELKVETGGLIRTKGGADSAAKIKLIALRCLAIARSRAPSAVQGAFIPTGADFDAFSALNRVFKSAKSSILVVDPYMDETVLTSFAILANEGVRIALLTDKSGMRAGLTPATTAWIGQYGDARHVHLRVAPARTLHDRMLLVDETIAYILTQSLKDFAARSPATIQGVDAELAAMKFDAYSKIWNTSEVIAETRTEGSAY